MKYLWVILGTLLVFASAVAFNLTHSSKKELATVNRKLQRVVELASQYSRVNFIVADGIRSIAQQREFVKRGVSKTMRSKHLLGRAVDLWAIDPATGRVTWDWAYYREIARAMKKAARELNIKIVWA